MATQTSLILFKDKRPNSCFLDQIYDPDVDGTNYVESDTGYSKIVPQEGATIIDRRSSTKGVLYYVDYVNPVTLKSTLRPTKIIVEANENGEIVRVISYGNDKFNLFIVDSTTPTKLIIDSKLILFGTSLVEYQLVKTNTDNTREIISVYLDSDENYRGTRIPMTSIGSLVGAKQCTNCHTLSTIKEGDTVTLECYDNVGILSATVTLFTVKGTVLNDLTSSDDIILDMTATSLQMLGDQFYIHQRQDPEHLGILPTLHYADGHSEDISIDNKTCFLYGLENFVATYPGQQQKLLIKKYLGNKQHATNAIANNGKTFITCEKLLTVVANTSMDSIKISIIPQWSGQEYGYTLKYIAYSDRRDKVYDVTSLVTQNKMVSGNTYYTTQQGQLTLDLKNIFHTDVSVTYVQNFWINFKPYAEYQRYIISDTDDMSKVYGVESTTMRRPVIHYDKTLKQYFIPTSKFGNEAAFIEAFYLAASPLFNLLSETEAPTPTHFTIRDADTLNTLITTPIKVQQYTLPWSINRLTQQDQLVGTNVIVEFLIANGNTYQILYGVPVDVFTSTTGYNTVTNDIK